ncbi:hypothetical protein G6F58_012493 [Rhizopus delemar]|nr:hypothetical protein G6F58_012493 [Rhizopus delemar]
MIPDNDRAILTRVEHPHGAFLSFYVLVLYAPASSGKLRQKFFGGIYDILHQSTIDVDLDRLFIMGDFNYSYQRRNFFSQTSMQWISFLETLFSNALTKDDLHELPTFRRNDDIFSTIDYIFVSDSLPRQPAYQQLLQEKLTLIRSQLPSGWSPQAKWDYVKALVKVVTRNYAMDNTNWRIKALRKLQSDRSKFLRSKPPVATRTRRLPAFDVQIASLQNELAEILALKANPHWCEEAYPFTLAY